MRLHRARNPGEQGGARYRALGHRRAAPASGRRAALRDEELDRALHYVNDLLQTGKTSIHSLGLNATWGDLRRSGWSTAQQRRSLEHLMDALVLVSAGAADPDTANRPDLDRFRDRLLVVKADLYAERQLATQPAERYGKALKEQVQ